MCFRSSHSMWVLLNRYVLSRSLDKRDRTRIKRDNKLVDSKTANDDFMNFKRENELMKISYIIKQYYE